MIELEKEISKEDTRVDLLYLDYFKYSFQLSDIKESTNTFFSLLTGTLSGYIFSIIFITGSYHFLLLLPLLLFGILLSPLTKIANYYYRKVHKVDLIAQLNNIEQEFNRDLIPNKIISDANAILWRAISFINQPVFHKNQSKISDTIRILDKSLLDAYTNQKYYKSKDYFKLYIQALTLENLYEKNK